MNWATERAVFSHDMNHESVNRNFYSYRYENMHKTCLCGFKLHRFIIVFDRCQWPFLTYVMLCKDVNRTVLLKVFKEKWHFLFWKRVINLDCREGKNVAKTAQLRGAIEKLLAVTIVRNACCDSHRIKFNPRPDQ